MPYLIDGDNVLWAWEFEGNIEEGRSQLLRIISKYQKNKRSKFIVFFDGPTKEKNIEN
ncbi:MAG: NYN domain-containing protein [Candidatus Aminicenantia bacterium]